MYLKIRGSTRLNSGGGSGGRPPDRPVTDRSGGEWEAGYLSGLDFKLSHHPVQLFGQAGQVAGALFYLVASVCHIPGGLVHI